MRCFVRFILVLALTSLAGKAVAHEVRPAYLEIRETTGNRFELLWKQPAISDGRLNIDPVLPETCQVLADSGFGESDGAALRRWTVDCGRDGLRGHEVRISGLQRTMIDVLVEVRLADGTSVSHVLRPDSPGFVVNHERSIAAMDYLRLGIEHLLLGFDHILFVMALTLVVRSPWGLVQTCTAFTVAHSLTLGLSVLDLVRLSQPPVEAVIALSILFLAAEVARNPGSRLTLTSRYPWVIAFFFGLLHGFGFAGALTEIGLPRDAVASALFLFNVGIEIGQLLIIATMLTLVFVLRLSAISLDWRLAQFPIVAVGITSAYWFLERLSQMP